MAHLERADAVNWSTLKYILTSPKHYLHALANPREDTDALLRGRVVHCAVYEPDSLASRYAVMPRFHGSWNDDTARAQGWDGGKQAKAEWIGSHSGVEVVASDLWAKCMGIRDALLADPIAAPMIRGGYAEQLVTWTDEATGIACRGRIDHIAGCLSDLKTVRSIEPRALNSDIARYLYHGQLGYYATGLEANGIALSERPAIIAAEADGPHDTLVVRLSDSYALAGRHLARRALDTLARCRESGEWPGVGGGRELEMEPPTWAEPESEPITMGGVAIF